MTNEPNHANHGGYERSDIGVAGIIYFFVGLALFVLIMHFIASGLYSVLEKRSQAEQKPISPLISSAPVDTRKLPVDYREYLKQNFPTPQLETDERTQLNSIIGRQEQQLNTYDYVNQKAGTVRIPIERAMDIIAERGLPTRGQSAAASTTVAAPAPAAAKAETKQKGKKK
jgi:hypothetical protein